jgi:hypothetical protein
MKDVVAALVGSVSELLSKGELTQAHIIASEALHLAPRDIRVMAICSLLALAQEDYDQVSSLNREIISLHPGFAVGYIREFQLMMVRFQYDEANKLCDYALKRFPGRQEFILGKAIIRALDYKGAFTGLFNGQSSKRIEEVKFFPGRGYGVDKDGKPILGTTVQRGRGIHPFLSGTIIGSPLSFPTLAIREALLIRYARTAHWGHFLTEFIAHAGCLLDLDLEGIPLILLGSDMTPKRWDKTCRIIQALNPNLDPLQFLPVSYAQFPLGLSVDTIHAFDPSLVLHRSIEMQHFTVVHRVIDRLYPGSLKAVRSEKRFPTFYEYSKLYLSRSSLNGNKFRRVMGEAELEARLARNGWKIVHPQEMPLPAQLSLYKNASVIASTDGSALHTLMYFPQPLSWLSIIVLAGEKPNPDIVRQLQMQQCKLTVVKCLNLDGENTKTGRAQDCSMNVSLALGALLADDSLKGTSKNQDSH